MKDSKRIRIALVGGGSGGHVSPVAEVAKELRNRDDLLELSYIGDVRDSVAKTFIRDEGLVDSYSSILSGKFRRYAGIKGLRKFKLWKSYLYNIRDLFFIGAGVVHSFGLLLFRRPQIIFSKGGYPAMPVLISARVLRIPVITHDSDAISGLAHKIVASYARVRLFGVPIEDESSQKRYVGVPIRSEYAKKLSADEISKLRDEMDLKKNQLLVVATGGGLGSSKLNTAVLEALKSLDTDKVYVYLVAGEKYKSQAEEKAADLSVEESVTIVGLSQQMLDLIRLADIVVTRAGATALAEITTAAKPSIVIPNPILPGAHQVHNIQEYISQDAILTVDDDSRSIDSEQLAGQLAKLVSDTKLRDQLSSRINALARTDATVSTAEVILSEVRD